MDYQKAASYWTEKEKDSVRMEPESLITEIEHFIQSHNTCALATADLSGFVRCTPVEYTYTDGRFWILTEGGQKFRGLEQNKNISAAIYDTYTGFKGLGSLQITGYVDVIEPWTEEYMKLLDYKHIPAEQLKKLPSPMNLIRITPVSYDFLLSELKEKGYDSRQHLDITPKH